MNRDVQIIAGLITEDPNHSADQDHILFEWFWKGLESYFKDPLEKQLSGLLDKAHIKQYSSAMGVSWEEAMYEAMRGLKSEFMAFQRHHKLHDPHQALQAFKHFQKTRTLPPDMARDPRELDRRGGEFNPGGMS